MSEPSTGTAKKTSGKKSDPKPKQTPKKTSREEEMVALLAKLGTPSPGVTLPPAKGWDRRHLFNFATRRREHPEESVYDYVALDDGILQESGFQGSYVPLDDLGGRLESFEPTGVPNLGAPTGDIIGNVGRALRADGHPVEGRPSEASQDNTSDEIRASIAADTAGRHQRFTERTLVCSAQGWEALRKALDDVTVTQEHAAKYLGVSIGVLRSIMTQVRTQHRDLAEHEDAPTHEASKKPDPTQHSYMWVLDDAFKAWFQRAVKRCQCSAPYSNELP